MSTAFVELTINKIFITNRFFKSLTCFVFVMMSSPHKVLL